MFNIFKVEATLKDHRQADKIIINSMNKKLKKVKIEKISQFAEATNAYKKFSSKYKLINGSYKTTINDIVVKEFGKDFNKGSLSSIDGICENPQMMEALFTKNEVSLMNALNKMDSNADKLLVEKLVTSMLQFIGEKARNGIKLSTKEQASWINVFDAMETPFLYIFLSNLFSTKRDTATNYIIDNILKSKENPVKLKKFKATVLMTYDRV